jgi:hypothetical protein
VLREQKFRLRTPRLRPRSLYRPPPVPVKSSDEACEKPSSCGIFTSDVGGLNGKVGVPPRGDETGLAKRYLSLSET